MIYSRKAKGCILRPGHDGDDDVVITCTPPMIYSRKAKRCIHRPDHEPVVDHCRPPMIYSRRAEACVIDPQIAKCHPPKYYSRRAKACVRPLGPEIASCDWPWIRVGYGCVCAPGFIPRGGYCLVPPLVPVGPVPGGPPQVRPVPGPPILEARPGIPPAPAAPTPRVFTPKPEAVAANTDTACLPDDLYDLMQETYGERPGITRCPAACLPKPSLFTPEELDAALKPEVGVLYLSHVDYRSSRRWDMAAVNRKAAALGILTLWDCSHSAGAVAVDLAGTGSDFAVGCGYKYLCGGPGSPAWLYVSPRHQDKAWPVIAGWMGHEDLFAFGPRYAPIAGVRRHLTGTPGILANEAMAAAVGIWKDVKVADLDWKHRSLSETLIRLLEEQCGEFGLKVTCPRRYEERGGAVIFSHPGAGSVTEALLESGVVSSFRRPDSIRFGLQPLALSHEDLWTAVARLREVLRTELWRDPRFAKVSV